MNISNFTVVVGVAIVFSMASFSFAEQEGTYSLQDTELTPESITTETSSEASSMRHEIRLMHLTIQKPEKLPKALENGRIVVSTVQSYDVTARGISSCSFTARHNIVSLLTTMGIYAPRIAQGDASDLIRFGRFNKTLTSFTDKNALLDALNDRRDVSVETVFDVYRFVSRRSAALQAHRVAVFLGEDDEWYILDPIDGEKTREPQLFKTYLKNDIDEAEWLVRLPGYSMIYLVSNEEFHTALPYLSPELQVFFHTHYFDVPQVMASNTVSFGEAV